MKYHNTLLAILFFTFLAHAKHENMTHTPFNTTPLEAEWDSCLEEICGPAQKVVTPEELAIQAVQNTDDWTKHNPELKEVFNDLKDLFKQQNLLSEKVTPKVISWLKTSKPKTKLSPLEEFFYIYTLLANEGSVNEENRLYVPRNIDQELAQEPYNLSSRQVSYVKERFQEMVENEDLQSVIRAHVTGNVEHLFVHQKSHLELSKQLKSEIPNLTKTIKEIVSASPEAGKFGVFQENIQQLKNHTNKEILTLHDINLLLEAKSFISLVFQYTTKTNKNSPLDYSLVHSLASDKAVEQYANRLNTVRTHSTSNAAAFAEAAATFLTFYNLAISDKDLRDLKGQEQKSWQKLRKLFSNRVSSSTLKQISSHPPPVLYAPSKDEMIKRFKEDLKNQEEFLRKAGEIFQEKDATQLSFSRLSLLSELVSINNEIDSATTVREISDFEDLRYFGKTAGQYIRGSDISKDWSTVLISYYALRDPDVFKGILNHELAHAFSFQFSKVKRSPQSTAYLKKLREECLSKMHIKPDWGAAWDALLGDHSGGTSFRENYQTEEDFADWVSAKLHPKKAKNPYCQFAEQSGNQYSGTFQGESPKKEWHSHNIHRILHVQSLISEEIPKTCDPLIEKYKLKRITKAQCN